MSTMGYLELITGPMFSSKTSTLLKVIDKYKNNVCVITHSFDTRYLESSIVSHDGISCKAHITCIKLMDYANSEYIKKNKYITIEEAQFFDDLVEFVDFLHTQNKTIFVCGLNMDYKLEPFENIAHIKKIANKVHDLHSYCYECNDKALYTKRINTLSTEKIVVGSHEMYKPTCLSHHS